MVYPHSVLCTLHTVLFTLYSVQELDALAIEGGRRGELRHGGVMETRGECWMIRRGDKGDWNDYHFACYYR